MACGVRAVAKPAPGSLRQAGWPPEACSDAACGRIAKRTPLRPSSKAPQFKPGLRTFHSFFRSKFKARKTPLSHGFSGLAAIKAGAKKKAAFRSAGNCRRNQKLRHQALPNTLSKCALYWARYFSICGFLITSLQIKVGSRVMPKNSLAL